jgi:hypothetical protein
MIDIATGRHQPFGSMPRPSPALTRVFTFMLVPSPFEKWKPFENFETLTTVYRRHLDPNRRRGRHRL